MVCVGQSGAGKSTIAAGFLGRGFDILADDVVPVDGIGSALPGFPRIKLWQDTADRIGIDTSGLRQVRPNMEKFSYPLGDRFADRSLPIRWVYVLSEHDESDTRIESIHGLQRFRHLLNNTYRERFMGAPTLKEQHLQHCSNLAGRIHLSRLIRPDDGFGLEGLVDAILADIEANP